MRLVIAGVPRAGKTTLAGPDAHHTDALIGTRAWSEASAEIATWFDIFRAPWTIEGVAAVRAFRKFLRARGNVAPCDRVVWLDTPRVALTPGQETMAKGCRTVWREVRPELLARNVHVEEL